MSITLLVVERDKQLCQQYCQCFSSLGLTILYENEFNAAQEILRSQKKIDLLLIDQEVGGSRGIELLLHIKNYENLRVQAIIIGDGEEAFVQKCFGYGASDYIVKPVNLILLKLKVESLVKNISIFKNVLFQKSHYQKIVAREEQDKEVSRFLFDRVFGVGAVDVGGVYFKSVPCGTLNGDYQVCHKSPNGNIFIFLIDATGHGLSATITIMPAITTFKAMVKSGFSLSQIVIETNKKLVNETPLDRFVAALIVEIDVVRGELIVWNGGMPPAYWLSNDGDIRHVFASQHMALGILFDDKFDAATELVKLPTDGFLFACTDGLLSQVNSMGEQFGAERLVAHFKRGVSRDVGDELVSGLAKYVGDNNFDDDVSICLIDVGQLIDINSVEEERAWTRGFFSCDSFTWQVKLSGRLIATQGLPPILNQYIQRVGVPEQACKKIFVVVSELVSNAIDHGVLKLSSKLKEEEGGFAQYFSDRQKGLDNLQATDFVELSVELQHQDWGCTLQIEVTDSGEGYSLRSKMDEHTAFSGRGLGLISSIFDELEVFPPGNKTRARLNIITEPSA